MKIRKVTALNILDLFMPNAIVVKVVLIKYVNVKIVEEDAHIKSLRKVMNHIGIVVMLHSTRKKIVNTQKTQNFINDL